MNPNEVPGQLIGPLVAAGAEESEAREGVARAISERERVFHERFAGDLFSLVSSLSMSAGDSAVQTVRDLQAPAPICAACRQAPAARAKRGMCTACYYRWYRAQKKNQESA